MKKTTLTFGFSLIELMIVVTIIGILASIALPSYFQYAKRARFTEVIAATQPFKLAVTLALQQGSPAAEIQNDTHGLPPQPSPSKNLASLKVENGIISAQGTVLSGNATYILQPNADGSSWTVKGSCIKAGLCETA